MEKVQIGECTLYRGDCLEVLPTLSVSTVDSLITSPPYAMQRAEQYGGVPESQYPSWTVQWMGEARQSLDPAGSALINIREHVRGGEISDYVHRTRLALRAGGWRECDELIWIKPHSMPVGHPGRPRRSWERILWFSHNRQPWCNPQSNGKASKKVGIDNRPAGVAAEWSATATKFREGVSRCRDYVEVTTAGNTGGMRHPAMYPVPLAEWMVRLITPIGGAVLDPFVGSGATGVACVRLSRSFIGIEKEPKYFDIACQRIEKAYADSPLLAGVA
jgi:site-specific DNA-methyltransferase (adenine-specific)